MSGGCGDKGIHLQEVDASSWAREWQAAGLRLRGRSACTEGLLGKRWSWRMAADCLLHHPHPHFGFGAEPGLKKSNTSSSAVCRTSFPGSLWYLGRVGWEQGCPVHPGMQTCSEPQRLHSSREDCSQAVPGFLRAGGEGEQEGQLLPVAALPPCHRPAAS